MGTYKKNFSEEELKQALHAHDKEAGDIIADPDKWEAFRIKVEQFMRKVSKVPVLGGLVDDIVSMIQMADSYVKKEYTDVPITSIVSIVAALIYLLSPIDLIPDMIPFVGYLDDAAVVWMVLQLGVGHDLKKYKLWREQQRIEALAELEKEMGKIITDMLAGDCLGALMLCKGQKFQILAVENDSIDTDDTPYSTKVYHLSLPVDILKDMQVDHDTDYLAFLNRVIKGTDFNWSPIGVLEAIHETEFDKYEDYFALVERDDGNE